MSGNINGHLKILRQALLGLKATGPDGFEGLVGAVLGRVVGVPFRLAGSGLQLGIDGKPAYPGEGVCFECKLYSGNLSRDTVLSKLAEAPFQHPEMDVWVLCATSGVTSQLADSVYRRSAADGLTALVYDWPENVLPPLAIIMAMAGDVVESFLGAHVDAPEGIGDIHGALIAIQEHPDFGQHQDKILNRLSEPSIGVLLAKAANVRWLTSCFTDRKVARVHFGQVLSPGDRSRGSIFQREALTADIQKAMVEFSDASALVVHGGEGNGKSWSVAQSWLVLPEGKPLCLVLTPDTLAGATPTEMENLLVTSLIKQTADSNIEKVHNRWKRVFGRWRRPAESASVNLVVVLDGINQRPREQWGRVIDGLHQVLIGLRGKLIVTVRTEYYRSNVKSRILSPLRELHIPEWSEEERDTILHERGFDGGSISPQVARSLRNPRLLGLAIELLDAKMILTLNELSVSRMLFEHMRASVRDVTTTPAAHEFAKILRDHAKEVLTRIEFYNNADLTVFNADSLHNVADGRFFLPVEGDPSLYSIGEEGLTLALGFALIEVLQRAIRNDMDFAEEAAKIIDPIAALDMSAAVVMSALIITCGGREQYSEEFLACIVRLFSSLQNPDDNSFEEFCGLARRRPEGFMKAAEDTHLEGRRLLNMDWLEDALLTASQDDRSWQRMEVTVKRWLALCCLRPDRSLMRSPDHDPEEKVREEREKKEKNLVDKMELLSDGELEYLNSLEKCDSNPSSLSLLALSLLAGKPLAGVAPSLVVWAFANALNPDFRAPDDEFGFLILLNNIDWSETRAALLQEVEWLRGDNVSSVGKWALVKILYKIGSLPESCQAKEIVDGLTRDWVLPGSWRRVEDYCASDPCDPDSEEPSNISNAHAELQNVDVSDVRASLFQTAADLDFEMARPALARFDGQCVINKHRELANDVVTRSGIPLKIGVAEMRAHCPLLLQEHIDSLRDIYLQGESSAVFSDLRESERWVFSQFCLLLIMPHITSSEQVELLAGCRSGRGTLLDIYKYLKPLDPHTMSATFERLRECSEPREKFSLMEIASRGRVSVPTDMYDLIISFLGDGDGYVRTSAMRLIASSECRELFEAAVHSGMLGNVSEVESRLHRWYGSVIVLHAAKMGILSSEEALCSIAPEAFSFAATVLDESGRCMLLHCLDKIIRRTQQVDFPEALPVIGLNLRSDPSLSFRYYSISEQPAAPDDIEEHFKRMGETGEAFEARQTKLHQAFDAFWSALSGQQVQVALDSISIPCAEALVAADVEMVEGWCRMFLGLDKFGIRKFYNILISCAKGIYPHHPDLALVLFRKMLAPGTAPAVNIHVGIAKTPWLQHALWSMESDLAMDEVRFLYLDSAGNDFLISQEVHAAMKRGRHQVVMDYIGKKLEHGEPADIARALTVAGFMDQSVSCDDLLERFSGAEGFIGQASDKAKYAYERNGWARHWYKKMCEAQTKEDFWRYSVLFVKIVDQRFASWRGEYTEWGEPMRLFWPSVERQVKSIFKKWADKRKKTLFGGKVPDEIYLNCFRICQ